MLVAYQSFAQTAVSDQGWSVTHQNGKMFPFHNALQAHFFLVIPCMYIDH